MERLTISSFDRRVPFATSLIMNTTLRFLLDLAIYYNGKIKIMHESIHTDFSETLRLVPPASLRHNDISNNDLYLQDS